MVADTLLIERLPDGRPSTNPFSAIRKLHHELKHSGLTEDPDYERVFKATTDSNGRTVWRYPISIRVIFKCVRAVEYLSAMLEDQRANHSTPTWQLRLLVCSRGAQPTGIHTMGLLKSASELSACPPLVRTRLVRRAREGSFRSLALAFARKASVHVYQQLRLLQAADFAENSEEQQKEIRDAAAGSAQVMLNIEELCCELCGKHSGIQDFARNLDGEIILLSGLLPIAIYMKEKGPVVEGVDAAQIGRTLFQRWVPRVRKVHWKRNRLNNERVHPAFVELFEQEFLSEAAGVV
jgi:hypothetical protein